MIIDDCKTLKGTWATGVVRDGEICLTRAGVVWNNMKARCVRESYRGRKPTYKDCYMSEDFKDFNKFAEWCQSQVGYGLPDYELDKDILFPGNKLYSPDTCVFVPSHVNAFLSFKHTKLSALPIGAYYLKARNRYRSTLFYKGKKILCKSFMTADDAHRAYVQTKAQCAQEVYEEMVSGKIVVDVRVAEFFKNWKQHYQPEESPYE